MNEITCNQEKGKNNNNNNFRNQLNGAKIQGEYIYQKKGRPDLISHPKPNHSVWTQQGQVIFP